MRVKRQLIICHDDGQEEAVTDVFTLNKNEGVSDLLITRQTDTPNSYRLLKRPITKSCRGAVVAKQSVRRTNRLIRVRKLMGLLALFCVLAFPPVGGSASRGRA